MACRFGALLMAAALVLGCGGGDGGQPGGGGSSGGAKAPGKAPETMPFPEKTLKDIGGSLAADPKLTEQNLDSYIRYMKSLTELQKGAGADPMALAQKMQTLSKDCGFKDDADMGLRMQQVAGGLGLLGVMAAAESGASFAAAGGPAAGAVREAYEKTLADLRKTAAEVGLSEADLRLVHRRMKDLQGFGTGG